jgi:hypothetical protein
MPESVQVSVDNIIRAETDMYFGSLVARGPGIGQFEHMRELRSVDLPGVRPNRDTLYSEAIFDLDAGPVAITLPDSGDRFRSMMLIDEDLGIRPARRRSARRFSPSTRLCLICGEQQEPEAKSIPSVTS